MEDGECSGVREGKGDGSCCRKSFVRAEEIISMHLIIPEYRDW